MIAAIGASSIIQLLVTVVIGFCVWLIVQWALSQVKIPEPFSTIIRVIIVLIVAVFCINALLGLTSHGGFIRW